MDVNRTPYALLPDDWAFDPKIGPFMREVLDELRQLRSKLGGDDDFIQNNDPLYGQAQLQQPPIEDGTADALAAASFANAIAASGMGNIPVGGIILWSGTTIPTGWQNCDGTNGSPDMRDVFPVGAGTTYAVNDTGGAVTDTSTVASTGTTVDNDGAASTVPVAGRLHTHEVDILPPYHAVYFIQRMT